MRKQTFYKQEKLKSQKSLENSPKNNYINSKKYPYYELNSKEEKEKFLNDLDKNSNNSNNEINHRKNFYKNNKKGKIGSLDYEIEPRNIFLIPDNFNINDKNLRICEKELLPKEKNYFISEKNFQLIKDSLNEKEEIIKELNYLLEKEKLKNKINNNIPNKDKDDINEKMKILEEDNKKLEKANEELILQIDKKNIYFNKIYQLLKFIFNYKDFIDPEIKNYIKDQDLEMLFDNEEILNNNNIGDSDTDTYNNLENLLFKVNKDIIMNELENYKRTRFRNIIQFK